MQRKALVIGLDGVPCTMLQTLMHNGIMPHMSSLTVDSRFAPLLSPLPPLSSVSWSSFMTGHGPGVHGIFGFTDLSADFDLRLPSFLDLKTPTIFERLGEKGLRSVVINLPATYPARRIPGVLVSGFVAPDLQRATWPPDLAGELRSMGYHIDIDLPACREDHDRLFEELHRTLEVRERTAGMLWERESWDLFVLVITGTDRLLHFCHDAWTDPKHPRREAFLQYFNSIDAVVGRLAQRFADIRDAEKALVLLSDHGFCQAKVELYLNRVLQDAGLLNYRTTRPRLPSDIDPATTRVFVLDPGRVYVNTRSRFNKGVVSEGQRQEVLDAALRLLTNIRIEGQHVIEKVIPAEQACPGPLRHLGPDAVLLARRGVELKGAPHANQVFAPSQLQGGHTQDNAFHLYHGAAASWPAPHDVAELSQQLFQWLYDADAKTEMIRPSLLRPQPMARQAIRTSSGG